jgi:alcohol dehydrogenase
MAEKRHSAKRVGLHETMTPAEADLADLRADVVIEAVGRASAFQHAYTWTAPGGITITVGLPSSDETIDLAPLGLVAEGRTVVGSYLGSAVPSRDIPIFVEMWRAGRLPVEHLVSSFIRLDQLNEGMDRLASGSVLRQIIDFSKEAAR